MNLGGFSFETKELKESDVEDIRQIKNSGNLAAVGAHSAGRGLR